MPSLQSPVDQHERRSTDSNKLAHPIDGVHRSHHVDSGLDVSEDANEGEFELIMLLLALISRRHRPTRYEEHIIGRYIHRGH